MISEWLGLGQYGLFVLGAGVAFVVVFVCVAILVRVFLYLMKASHHKLDF